MAGHYARNPFVMSASSNGESHYIMSTTIESDAPPRPRVMFIAPGEGTEYSVLGHVILCLLSEEQTGGAFSLFQCAIPPGGGPPPHIHGCEDETFGYGFRHVVPKMRI